MNLQPKEGSPADREHRKRPRPDDMAAAIASPPPSSQVLQFEDAFAPLAYHLFPDGCPLSAARSTDSRDDGGLKEVWPQSRNSRSIVSANEALVAVKQLERLGKRVGFQNHQQDAMVLAACATLVSSPPSNKNKNASSAQNPLQEPEEQQWVVQRSKLRDGTSLYFRTLLRMTLPQRQQPISKYSVMKVLSTLRSSSISSNSNSNKQQQTALRMDDMGMISSMQFLTLCVRNGALSGQGRRGLSAMYSVLFPLAMKAALCGDAVRLLHAITRRSHVRVYRAQRLREFLVACPAEQQVNFAPLWLLLQLYASYDPQGCGRFFAAANKKQQVKKQQQRDLKGYARCFSFPDLVWERNFTRTWQRDIVASTSSPLDHNHNVENQGETHQKRPRSSSTVVATLDRLVDSFEGVQSFSSGFGPNKKRSLRASDLLKDATLSHLLVLSSSTNNIEAGGDGDCNNSSTLQEAARLKVCLPFMLQQEWYHKPSTASMKRDFASDNVEESGSDNEEESLGVDTNSSKEGGTLGDSSNEIASRSHGDNSEDDSEPTVDKQLVSPAVHTSIRSERSLSRLRVIDALASVAVQTGSIPPEAESMLDEILRSWDGSEEWGAILCYDILPCVSTTRTFSELRSKVLVHLEKFFLYGTSKLQHAIISGTLASLLANIAAAQSRDSERQGDSNNHQRVGVDDHLQDAALARRKLIKELMHWTDGLLLQGFLSKREGGSELLSCAAVDFFHVVCREVSRHFSLLVLPSTNLVYRLLLSKSPVSIDRVCQLLVDYKDSFQRLKQEQEKDISSVPLEVEGLDQVAVFNCLVWDFCSVLFRNSSLPSCPTTSNAGTESSDMATKMSILFTDLAPNTLAKLNEQPLDSKVRAALSITQGAVFAQYASDFVRTRTGSTDADVSVDALKGKLKQEYLDYLKEECGMEGLHAFLVTFIGSLAKREKRKKQKSLESVK